MMATAATDIIPVSTLEVRMDAMTRTAKKYKKYRLIGNVIPKSNAMTAMTRPMTNTDGAQNAHFLDDGCQ